MSESIQIIIATHKKYRMPKDSMYLPLHVGAEGKTDDTGKPLDLGYVKDNTGDNISTLNPSFCELTGLYWAWKNVDAEYIGLAHYRRHFSYKHKAKDPFLNILTKQEAENLIKKYSILVPRRRIYYIETLYSHYEHTHYISQLDETRKIIKEKYPDYVQDFDKVVKRVWGYMFNMTIMRKDFLDEYCSWLFDILFELHHRAEIDKVPNGKNLSVYQSRFYGRISEIIFNVWLEHQLRVGKIKRRDIKEIPYIYTEPINWWNKGSSFLKAKFLGKKYGMSF